jgi:LmbE family N-acetylglucosaminyl deacetylase
VSVLIVVAHPDDEVLGAGGLAASLAASGRAVHSCILCGAVEARGGRPELAALHEDIRRAHRILGLGEPILGGFPNIAFNTVPHLELVRFVEGAVRRAGATEIYTHHPGDLNDDHRHASHAAQVAARLHQRDRSVPPLRRLAFMEVLSSSDWAFPLPGEQFVPNAFFSLPDGALERKLEALGAYRGVMRPFPHPRSPEIVRGLAAYRGGQCGEGYAEAFQIAYQRMDG